MRPGFTAACEEALAIMISFRPDPEVQKKAEEFMNKTPQPNPEEAAEALMLSARAVSAHFNWAADEAKVILEIGIERYTHAIAAVREAKVEDAGTTLATQITAILVFGVTLGERMERCRKQ